MKSIVKYVLIASVILTFILMGQYVGNRKMTHVVSMIWYNFEGETEPEFKHKLSFYGIEEKTKLKRYDYTPNGLGESKGDSKQSLGIATSFKRKGYNWIDIFADPAKEKGRFPGVVQSLDMWVWGGNFQYKMECVLEDYKGYIYSLPMGTLRYFGWRNKSLKIPNAIPQAEPYAPRSKGLKFRKFRIYSTPGERVDRFHCFFDYFKLVTDSYRDQYDGWELEKVISDEIGESELVEKNAKTLGQN